jgi:hypothetical protein
MSIIKASIFKPYTPIKSDSNSNLFLSCNVYNEENIFFTPQESKNYENLVNSLLNQKVDTSLTGKVYLGKLSSLPRHKIKDYFKENKIIKTSRLDQSDTIILNKEYLIEFNGIFNSDYSWQHLKPCKTYTFTSEQDKDYLKSSSKIWHSNLNPFYPFIILIEDDDRDKPTSKLINFLQNKKPEDLLYKTLYRGKNLVEVHNYLEYILKNPNVKVVFDENIMDPLNEEGFELDEEYLTTLDGMFESKLQDNINLALEMLSNVNIEKNSLTIALFLNKHKSKFIWGSGLSINTNNSFKSTLKYFKSKNINFDHDWRSFSANLYKLHKSNPKNIEIINDFIQQNINQYLKEFNPNHYIEVKLESLALKS